MIKNPRIFSFYHHTFRPFPVRHFGQHIMHTWNVFKLYAENPSAGWKTKAKTSKLSPLLPLFHSAVPILTFWLAKHANQKVKLTGNLLFDTSHS